MTTLKNQSLRVNRSISQTIRLIKQSISPEQLIITLMLLCLFALIWAVYTFPILGVLPLIGLILLVIFIKNNYQP